MNEDDASKWTTKPPTKPGVYWAHWSGGIGVTIAEMINEDNDYVSSGGREYPLDVFRLWYGPIEEPPLPESGEEK